MGRLAADRLAVGLGLLAVAALAWVWLWRQAAPMNSGMAMDAMAPGVVPLFAMWVVMMAAMMLPSAAPTVLLYAAMVGKHAQRSSALPAPWIFAAGYLLAWTAFSLVAALLQAALQQAALLDAGMASASRPLSAVLFAAAGAYQLTPLKDRCLSRCQEPLAFLMTRWRPGASGALRMGVENGAYCVGCCAFLMLLLFAVGVMSLAWVAAVAVAVLVEKLLPAGRFASRFAGAALLVLGAAMLLN